MGEWVWGKAWVGLGRGLDAHESDLGLGHVAIVPAQPPQHLVRIRVRVRVRIRVRVRVGVRVRVRVRVRARVRVRVSERAAEGTLRHLRLLLRREDRLRTPRRAFARAHACRNGGARQACLGFCGRPACGLCGSSRARRTANVRCTVALCSPPSVHSARLQQSSAAAYSPALYAFCALVSRLFSEDIAS